MFRISTAIAALFLLCAPAFADDVSTRDVYACKALSGDAERLACYDTAVGRLEAAEQAGEVTTVSRKEVEQVKRDSFGFSIPSLPSLGLSKLVGNQDKVADIENVTEAIESISGDRGNLRVRLSNGQVWVQKDGKKVRPKGQKEAYIYQAALGSYKMKLDGGLAFRVERTK